MLVQVRWQAGQLRLQVQRPLLLASCGHSTNEGHVAETLLPLDEHVPVYASVRCPYVLHGQGKPRTVRSTQLFKSRTGPAGTALSQGCGSPGRWRHLSARDTPHLCSLG